MELHLITYGCGDRFDPAKFSPIKNREFVKPAGGPWASPVNSKYGWRAWCEDANYGDLSQHFEFYFCGNVFVIDGVSDAARMPWYKPAWALGDNGACPDFEKLMLRRYDAIWLTVKGERETRFGQPSLYGWDCECVLIMNPYGILASAPGAR